MKCYPDKDDYDFSTKKHFPWPEVLMTGLLVFLLFVLFNSPGFFDALFSLFK